MAKASTRLAASQPAVSKTISEMEYVLGVPLLDGGVLRGLFIECVHEFIKPLVRAR